MRLTLTGLLLCLSATAHAIETGSIEGTITDAEGQMPLAGIKVDVDGTTVTTDAEGRFLLELIPAGPHTMLFEDGHGDSLAREVEVGSDAAAQVDVALSFDGEVVRIRETLPSPPVTPPVPAQSPVVNRLPRTDELIDSNRAAIVWLMTTVDPAGVVIDARVLEAPMKLHLDDIALAEARALRFHPALDAAGQPTLSHAVVKVEWQPSFALKLNQLEQATCIGEGPLNLGFDDPTYRLCD